MSRPFGVAPLPSPPLISPTCRLALGGDWFIRTGFGAPASGASPWSDAANTVLAFPFVLEANTTFYKGFWVNGSGTIGGTRDVAIYDESYNLLVGTGAATSASGTSVPQAVALTATTELPPGRYYAGMSCSVTTTGNQYRWSLATSGTAFLQAAGCWKFSDDPPISSATATPGDLTNVAFPVFGLITRSVFDL